MLLHVHKIKPTYKHTQHIQYVDVSNLGRICYFVDVRLLQYVQKLSVQSMRCAGWTAEFIRNWERILSRIQIWLTNKRCSAHENICRYLFFKFLSENSVAVGQNQFKHQLGPFFMPKGRCDCGHTFSKSFSTYVIQKFTYGLRSHWPSKTKNFLVVFLVIWVPV